MESELSSFDVETTRMFYGLFGNLFTLTNYQLKLALLHPIDPQAAQANDTVIDFRTIFSQECSCVHYKKMGTSVFYTPESIAQSDAQCHEDFFADQLKIRKIFKLHYEHGGIASCEQMLAYFADEKANLCQRRAPLMWFLLTTVISEEHKRTLGLFKETVTIGFKRKQNVGDAQEESVKTQVATSQSSSLTSGVTTTTKNAATMETRDDNIEAEDEGDDDQQEKRIKTN